MIIPRKMVKDPAWIQVKLSNHLTGARLFTDNPHNCDDEPTLSERLYKP